ncbi:RNA polymerase II transcriptional coactivator, putative [Candida dubliniensis CD36]|uniref:RNA polymerase II transcriptional coactivator, putative n=1 Tax=Candida dubliniensis (strain CD36 / ATCC MYA-646 / CBS 7987 / NCPF 3949 / NRRL Y-17841) TaxID=573826 RepID=B9WFB3_CANDC|nr:RNA polymerase II transcriptional coactivator, putative [Candida dubliniensis CD36]CAX41932.1 RNA polymerase II transcriptional coactivator, putative [Candida dubliniensis CD36]
MAFRRGAPASFTSTSNEVEISLDSKKQVTVRKFNNVNLVDIREFYTDKEGVKRPGKKGISLTEDAYYKLLEATNKIQNALDDLNGGASNKRVKLDNKQEKRDKPLKKEPERKAIVEKEEEVTETKQQVPEPQEEEEEEEISDADE